MSRAITLWHAWLDYARGKRRWPAVARFALDADAHVLALHRALAAGAGDTPAGGSSFEPAPYAQHLVRDPKVRLISAPAIRDRVLHHAVVEDIGPAFVRGFIADSYACLAGRGPQRAVWRYLAWTRRHRWRLSLDIRRYFPSIGHARLLALVFRKLRDEPMRALIARLIEHGGAVYQTPLAAEVLGEPPAPGQGIPIGSCLSQWAANLYLDGLDQYVKRTLKVGAYLRYMDDAVLFADDRGELVEARAAIAEWLARERGLALNPKRGYIVPAAEPSTYLGYRVSRAGLSPGRKARRRMRGKLREAAERGPDAVRASLESYRALFALG